jgi:pyruvate/2-oxoglutarate dehydrogenase complex dihydrolipoamide acyltransferase (E2) component
MAADAAAMHITRPPASLLSLLTVAVLAAGCGGSSSAAGSGSSSSSSDRDAAQVKFRSCMRENGVDIPDTPGQGGGAARADIDQATLQKAQKACAKYRQAAFGDVTTEERQQFRDAFAKFASCMRQHDVDVPDPGTGGGAGGGGGGGVRARLDQNDPKVKAATAACQDKLPQRRGGQQGGQ